jgi:Fe2+ transport system protein FeoA
MKKQILSKLTCGEKGKIVKIRGQAAIHRLLFEQGIVVGRAISIENTGFDLNAEYIEVRLNGSTLSLTRDVASGIQIEIT